MSDARAGRPSTRDAMTRREALRTGASCAAWLLTAQALMPHALQAAFARRAAGGVVAAEPFGRLEEVARGTWALVSTPFGGDRTTLANGGIVAGRQGVVVIEGLFTPQGATWLASQARALTGRWPTHLVVTHHHADHANGLVGYAACGDGCAPPRLHVTGTTRATVLGRTPPPDAALAAAMRDAVRLDDARPSTIELGDRALRVTPMRGHTASDVLVDVPDARVVFAGDLAWNGVFPNYVDASPSAWRTAADALPADDRTRVVPGHGSVMDASAVRTWRALLGEVEHAARRAHGAGTPADVAATAWAIPPALGDWALFGLAFLPRAFARWYRELDGTR